MQGNSRSVSSNQEGIHEQLDSLVKRYLTTHSRRPIQPHTETAFALVCDWLQGQKDKIIIDSCCGIGESSARLASLYPNHRVIGIDKSAQRVAKHQHHFDSDRIQESALLSHKDNYCVVRADVIDFWRLVRREQWQVDGHYLLYPNPYPKASQLQKRWYASASLQDLLLLKGHLQVRSNWQLYLQEFQYALRIAGVEATLTAVAGEDAMTPFERKYQNSGQTCWRLDTDLSALNSQSWQWDD
ncbi:MAG: tRNA (guanine(46)-N(7))-methyltransferase TrmB [Aestuariibacter sp.]